MSIQYRPEIDGLRAIAVLSVLFYHANFIIAGHNPIKGGFIGVDIFFVISGYLITSIILREMAQGTFRFTRFYERRARRILPALFAVMLATLPYAWFRLLPTGMADFSGSALSSLLMVSNYWFAHSSSYWDAPSALKPLLHTWSLSVEEQFYVIFPIFLLLIYKYAKQALLPAMAVLFVVSIAVAEYTRQSNPEFAFFLLPSRGWELLAGALLAKTQHVPLALPTTVQRLLPSLGLAMVMASMVFFHKDVPHPSLLTLIPIIGAALLIRFSNPHEWVGRVLSFKPIVSIGLISYSLYLWHFPVFAFARIKHGQLSNWDKLENVALSFGLAIVSYLLIEKTMRNQKAGHGIRLPMSAFASITGLAFIALLVFSIQGHRSNGYPDRFVDFAKLLEYEHYPYEKDFLSHTCFLHPEDMTATKPFSQCQFNGKANSDEKNNKPTLMLWGDSNAAHLIPGIRKRYENEYNLLIRTSSGCGAFIGYFVPRRPGCLEINDELLQLAIATQPEKLVIAGLWKPEFPALLEKTISALQQGGVNDITIVGPVPRWQGSLPRALIEYGQQHQNTRQLPQYLSNPRHQEVYAVEQLMQNMAHKTGVTFISLLKLICQPEKGCLTQANKDGQLMQWDYGHLTSDGAIYLMERIDL